MDNEVWKEVYGFNVLYEVSNKGRVRTRYTSGKYYSKDYTYLEPCDNGNGYLRFNWSTGKCRKTVYVHRLVAEAFIPNPMGYLEVNHIDEDKSNNSVDNLEWCNRDYNTHYGTRIKRSSSKRERPIECIDTGVIYPNFKSVLTELNVGKTALSNCLNGRSKSCSGMRWRYVNVHT